MGIYIKNDVRNHVVRYVETDVPQEIGRGNDVISYVFLYVVSNVLSYIVCKTSFLHLLI